MLSIEKCKKILKDNKLNDEEIVEIRQQMYSFAELVLRDLIKKNDLQKNLDLK